MKKVVLYVSLSIALVSLSYYALPSKVSAAKGLPFGGRIGFVLPCINGLLVVVVTPDPRSVGPYIITPAVIPRAFYAPFIGHAIKGSYIPGIPCYIPPFVVIPTKGAIVEFGTSLLPSVPGAILIGGAVVGAAAVIESGAGNSSTNTGR